MYLCSIYSICRKKSFTSEKTGRLSEKHGELRNLSELALMVLGIDKISLGDTEEIQNTFASKKIIRLAMTR